MLLSSSCISSRYVTGSVMLRMLRVEFSSDAMRIINRQ